MQKEKQTRDDHILTLQDFHLSGFPNYIKAKERQKGYKLLPLLYPHAIRRAAGNRRKDVRCPRVRGQACLRPEGIHLILCLRLLSQHALSSLSLSKGGPVLRIPNESRGALPSHSGLLSRSLCSKYHHDASCLRNSSGLPCPGNLHLRHGHANATLGQVLQKQR
jgi:hypothetical protein